jgi:TPR repeat protein
MKFKLIAANGGYALAQHDVALMYMKQKDWKQSAYWSKRAADQGELVAILFYASFVSNPLFEQYDPSTAWVYGKIASNIRQLEPQSGQSQTANNLQADKNLQVFLDKLDANFTPEQREIAQAKVQEWKAQPSAISLEAKRGIETLKVLLGDLH